MSVLGYPRFGAAGGDMDSHVSRYLALNHADRVVAVHRTDAGLPIFTGDPADLTPEERAWLQGAAAWGAAEGAYAAMHRTKPQTAAFGGLAGADGECRTRHRARTRRTFRTLRGARVVRRGTARVLSPVSEQPDRSAAL